MTIELPKDVRQQAISSIERYFQENMDEKIGNIAAGGLLGFFVEEIGPCHLQHGGSRSSGATANSRHGD